MKTFSNEEITEYYDKTEVHYKSGWDLNDSLAMHYGYWKADTKNFRESLKEMNRKMAEFGQIPVKSRVLDAGCGVGGSSIFLAEELACKVTGITLSQKQVESATKNAAEKGVSNLVDFQKVDFTKTPFSDASFDRIWGLESVVHANDASEFLQEAHRILRPGGVVVLGEYYKANRPFSEKEEATLQKWLNAWAIADICTQEQMRNLAQQAGFSKVTIRNITPQIRKSAQRMYLSSFYLGTISALYRIYNPKVSFFADNHYKAMRNQYPALKQGLWDYCLVRLEK